MQRVHNNHDAEDKLLQTVEILEDEEYKSTEGNEAMLYQLKEHFNTQWFKAC